MSVLNRLNIGIVGVCGGYGRGGQLIKIFNSIAPCRVHALCDVDRARLDAANEQHKVAELYYDYDDMLARSDLDAVFLATPMHLHVPEAIAALRRGVHVLSEVTAATDLDQARQLVAACKASPAVYMMAENYLYITYVAVVREMVLKGLFGQTYYGQGAYIADLKALAELTPWRRKWQAGVNGNPYITHNLGPILQWMPGRRVVRACCVGSGRRHVDPRGVPYEGQAACTFIGALDDGGQIMIQSDFLSTRPGQGVFNDVFGTDGCFEDARGGDHKARLWASALSQQPQWTDLAAVKEQYLPEYMKKAVADGLKYTSDHWQVLEFVRAIESGRKDHPLNVHESLDLTIPGLISQLSADAGGAWIEVPDSRTW